MNVVDIGNKLPYDFAPGERVLWFGRPQPTNLWRRAYRADWVAVYVVVTAAWTLLSESSDAGLAAGALGCAKILVAGAVGLGLLYFLAWLSARTTLFVVSTRRVVLKVGIALPIFYNLPFSQISGATLRVDSDGAGDVCLAMTKGQRVAYLTLWPAARPFRFTHPEPTLRSIANAREVAATLGDALREAAGETRETRAAAPAPRARETTSFPSPALGALP